MSVAPMDVILRQMTKPRIQRCGTIWFYRWITGGVKYARSFRTICIVAAIDQGKTPKVPQIKGYSKLVEFCEL